MFTHKYICSIVTLDVQINAWKRAICRYPWTKNYPNSNTGEKIEKFFIWHTGTSRLGQVCSFLELRTVYITGGCEMRRSLVPKRKWRETPFPLGPNHTWTYGRNKLPVLRQHNLWTCGPLSYPDSWTQLLFQRTQPLKSSCPKFIKNANFNPQQSSLNKFSNIIYVSL